MLRYLITVEGHWNWNLCVRRDTVDGGMPLLRANDFSKFNFKM